MEGIIENEFCLTCSQRYMVHRLQIAPSLAIPSHRIYRFNRSFDHAAFVEAISHTVALHPSLRLKLIQNTLGWRQCFPDQGPNISAVEVEGRNPEKCLAVTKSILQEERKKAMDLRNESPIKVKVIKMNGEYLLSLCIDHIAADGISFDLFERELVNAYRDTINGCLSPSPPSQAFLKYIAKEAAQQSMEKNNLLYWKQQLKGAPLNINIEVDLSLTAASLFNYQITGETFQLLLNFCRANKTSTFHLLVATELLLLAQTRNLNEIVLTIPVSNRVFIEEQIIIANLAMPLHFRFSVSPDEPASYLLRRVRDQITNAMVYRKFDFPSLSEFMAMEAYKQGYAGYNLHQSCSLIMDKEPFIFPNDLFAERLDDQLLPDKHVWKTSFEIDSLQTKESLSLRIKWDASTWPISIDEMENQFLLTLEKFLGRHPF